MWVFLSGLGAMAAFLAVIGITRNRVLGVKGWTAVWTSASLAFAGFIVAAFAFQDALFTEAVQGAAAGYVLSVGVHTAHHYVELRRKVGSNAEDHPQSSTSPGPASERRRIRRRAILVAGLLVFHAALLVRTLSTGSLVFAALLVIPVGIFAVRLVAYGTRLASFPEADTPAT